MIYVANNFDSKQQQHARNVHVGFTLSVELHTAAALSHSSQTWTPNQFKTSANDSEFLLPARLLHQCPCYI